MTNVRQQRLRSRSINVVSRDVGLAKNALRPDRQPRSCQRLKPFGASSLPPILSLRGSPAPTDGSPEAVKKSRLNRCATETALKRSRLHGGHLAREHSGPERGALARCSDGGRRLEKAEQKNG